VIKGSMLLALSPHWTQACTITLWIWYGFSVLWSQLFFSHTSSTIKQALLKKY